MIIRAALRSLRITHSSLSARAAFRWNVPFNQRSLSVIPFTVEPAQTSSSRSDSVPDSDVKSCGGATKTSSALHPRGARRLLPRSTGPLVSALDESELEEKFVSGGGRGGQKVNKARNAVFLRHVPTNIHVKVHAARSLAENRRLARQRLWSLLDEHSAHIAGTLSFRDQRILNSRQAARRAEARSRRKHAAHAAERTAPADTASLQPVESGVVES